VGKREGTLEGAIVGSLVDGDGVGTATLRGNVMAIWKEVWMEKLTGNAWVVFAGIEKGND
jgi:hypothetical protein